MKTKTYINEERANSEEFRDYIIQELQNREVTVTFTKKDGTERVMRCTRDLRKIPSNQQPSGSMAIIGTTAVRVFDFDADGWRSFNPESVKSIEL